jgi:hypothetical protein
MGMRRDVSAEPTEDSNLNYCAGYYSGAAVLPIRPRRNRAPLDSSTRNLREPTPDLS